MTVAEIEICRATAAYARLREMIMGAELLPHAIHDVTTTAQQLGIASADLRIAISRLENERLVAVGTHDRFSVVPISACEIALLHQQAQILEALAAELAASQEPSAIGLRALDDAVATMDDAWYRRNFGRWAQANRHFHRSLVQCSNDSHLIAAALPLSEPVHRSRMMALRLQDPPPETAQEHADIVSAIRTGRARDARELHVQHWSRTSKATLSLLEQHGLSVAAS